MGLKGASFLWIKVKPDPGELKRPDPTGSGSGSATPV